MEFLDKDSPSTSETCDAAVGVGSVYCTQKVQFDHTPFNITGRASGCAARLEWEDLLARGFPLASLAPLIDAVETGESPRRRASSTAGRQKVESMHARVARGRRETAGN